MKAATPLSTARALPSGNKINQENWMYSNFFAPFRTLSTSNKAAPWGEWWYSVTCFNLGVKWRQVVSFTPRAAFVPQKQSTGPIAKAVWVGPRSQSESLANRKKKILDRNGRSIRKVRVVQTVLYSLYRLNIPAPVPSYSFEKKNR